MKMRMKEEARFNEYDMVIFDVVLRDVHEGLPIDAVDYRNYVSVHRMVMENRPVDPGCIQGSHRCRMAEVYGKGTQGSVLAWRTASLLLIRLLFVLKPPL